MLSNTSQILTKTIIKQQFLHKTYRHPLYSHLLYYRMSFLHIAEKNSIAKEISNILSNNNKKTGSTLSKYNPVFQFTLDGESHRFSSVRGHIFDYELPPECKSWYYFDNKKILTKAVSIVKKLGPDMQFLCKNLETLAKRAKTLVLWLDCDRQGQAIAFEVIQIITKINPKVIIRRARFSAVTRTDILHAYSNLVNPNQRQAAAVNYRIQIDFRLGCTFTRYQTTTFQLKFTSKQNTVLSYGPCQLPTLGFVVQRYLQIKYFKPQEYYFLSAVCVLNQETGIDFKWLKKNTRNKAAINIIYKEMYERSTDGKIRGKIIKRSVNIKKRYRPFPLTTVQLQKIGTDKLKMSSAQIMSIAQKLYQKGYISYPRTQTNAFPKNMKVRDLAYRLNTHSEYADYVNKMMQQNKYMPPKLGSSNDQAHAPIHPVKSVAKDQLTPDEWKVYDLISRHFLACCSKDAVGEESEVLADIAGEQFKASYLTIKELNYLEIYPFQKWANSKLAGQVPQEFSCLVKILTQKTKPPAYLSESNLIEMMQKNNIGTDSTIHQHIETIQKRKYAVKINNTFKPTNLGAGLIIAYKNLGLTIAECDVRRMIESSMERIARGEISQSDAVVATLDFMMPIYDDLVVKKQVWLKEISQALQTHKALLNVEVEEKLLGNNNTNSGVRGGGLGGIGNSFNPNSSNNVSRNNIDLDSSVNSNRSFNDRQIPGGSSSNATTAGYSTNFPSNQSFVGYNNDTNTQTHAQGNSFNSSVPSTVICYKCKQPGHFANQCMGSVNNNMNNRNAVHQHQGNKIQEQHSSAATVRSYQGRSVSANTGIGGGNSYSSNNSNNMSGITCYRCNQKGHFANVCPQLNKKVGVGNNKSLDSFQHKNFHHKNNFQKKPAVTEGEEREKKKKVCQVCGIQGRHEKNSTCASLKRNQQREG